jgi:hypothetical protein
MFIQALTRFDAAQLAPLGARLIAVCGGFVALVQS